MAGWYLWAAAGVVAFLLIGSVVPLPGFYNVSVKVDSYEVGVLVGAVFGITSVSGATAGQSTLLDWQAFGLGFTWGVSLSWTMKVCLDGPGGHYCTSKGANQWFGSVPILGSQVTASNTFVLGYVQAGSYTITATLTGNGQSASGTGQMSVGG